jgi:phage shock protein PspC (stress-responsive transcriptional regulator)
MKKTITSSIGGIVFHVEEDAHQKLSNYLDEIKFSLQNSAGRDEIMADIEARIAELLQQRVKDIQQVVTIADVDEIVQIMGSPEAFSTGEEGSKKQGYTYSTYAGNSNYKRVFRDPDDKVLFGVCSGIAHHFGIDPLWIRLAFGLSFLLGGFGFILYILLTIILPKAYSAAEKLEMRGEPVDINNIKRRVEEEMEDLKNRASNFSNDYRNGRYRNTGRDFGRRTGDFFSSVGHGVGGVVGGIIKGVFAFVGFILIFIFSVLLIALVVSLFTDINVVHLSGTHGHWAHYSVHNIFTMLAINGVAKNLLITGLALFLCIPLLAIIIRIGRASIGVKNKMHGLRIVLFIAWMAGLVFLLIGAFQTFGHFSVTSMAKQEINFSNQVKTLYVNMPDEDYGDVTLSIDSLNFYIMDNNTLEGNPSICIQSSPDSNFHLEVEKYARGISLQEASESANGIDYSFSQHDSVLNLSPTFQLQPGTGWRKQKMELSLLIPANKIISLPVGIDKIMCYNVHKGHYRLGGHKWFMSQNGLVAADSASVTK